MYNHRILRRLLHVWGVGTWWEKPRSTTETLFKDTAKLNIHWADIKSTNLHVERMASSPIGYGRLYWCALTRAHCFQQPGEQPAPTTSSCGTGVTIQLCDSSKVSCSSAFTVPDLVPPDSDCRVMLVFTENSHWLVFFGFEGQLTLWMYVSSTQDGCTY